MAVVNLLAADNAEAKVRSLNSPNQGASMRYEETTHCRKPPLAVTKSMVNNFTLDSDQRGALIKIKRHRLTRNLKPAPKPTSKEIEPAP